MNIYTLDKCSFGCVFSWEHDSTNLLRPCFECHDQGSVYGPEYSIQRQLSKHQILVENIRVHLARCSKIAERNRKVIRGSLLFYVCRCKIKRYSMRKKQKAGVLDRRDNAF